MPGFELIGEEELREVEDVFSNGGVLFRHGFDALRNNCFKVKAFEKAFACYMGKEFALGVTSGTAALRVALAALEVGPGDEVITQSFTFVATVEAIIEAGATPVCAEIDKTLNLDPEDFLKKITPKTKAVIVVHMLGTPADLTRIREICQDHKLFLIEDTAWGCGGNLKGVPLGTWGDIGTYSFDFAKTMTTGEGGMLVFRDEEIFLKAAAWHDHGHENNPAVPRWEDTRSSSGFNYRMMELQGAVGLAQLKKLDRIVEAQRQNRDLILKKLQQVAGIEFRSMPEASFDTADALVFFVEDKNTAILCREALLEVGLSTKILPEAYSWHFAGTWHHMRELVESHGGKLESAFARSETLIKRAVSIPVTVSMHEDVPVKIQSAIKKALKQ